MNTFPETSNCSRQAANKHKPIRKANVVAHFVFCSNWLYDSTELILNKSVFFLYWKHVLRQQVLGIIEVFMGNILSKLHLFGSAHIKPKIIQEMHISLQFWLSKVHRN